MIYQIKQIIHNINKNKFKRYFKVSLVLFITLLIISGAGLTYARYETDTILNLKPSIAFFIVDATSETKTLTEAYKQEIINIINNYAI